MKNVGFGIVGCGFFGAEFARILHKLEGATVAAVYGGSGAAQRLLPWRLVAGSSIVWRIWLAVRMWMPSLYRAPIMRIRKRSSRQPAAVSMCSVRSLRR